MRRSSLLLCGLLAAAIVVPGTVVWAATPTDEDTVEADAAMGSTGPTGFTDDIREGVPSDAGEEVGQPSEGQEDVVSQGGSKEAPASNTPAAAMPSPRAPEPAGTASAVYVDGKKGSDSNSGTIASQPVRTFQKAKSLLAAGGTIYVVGEISPQSDGEIWSLGAGQTLQRYKDYHGDLISVTAHDLTLENITVSGTGEGFYGMGTQGEGQGGSLVYVGNGKTLTLNSGATLQDNKVNVTGNWYPESGGGVFANGGTVNINEGATIKGNQAVWGGGVYGIYGATINMSGGTITGNQAVKGSYRQSKHYKGGCGGGVCLAAGASMNLTGGTVSGNTAYQFGGGICVGPELDFKQGQPSLAMTGGTVDGNKAESDGGGIFVQAGGTADTFGKATITAGSITNNTSGSRGNAEFGGAGIYVNGGRLENAEATNGVLEIYDALITENTADGEGGGFAGCPSSDTTLLSQDGAAFFGNQSKDGSEIYLYASSDSGSHWTGPATHDISPYMLGGGAYNWKAVDGKDANLASLSGDVASMGHGALSMGNEPGDEAKEAARAHAKVFITGNHSATRGGGIGSNGTVRIGRGDTTQVSATKVWQDSKNADGIRPGKVSLEVYRHEATEGDEPVAEERVGLFYVTGGTDGTAWPTVTVKNLPKTAPDGRDYVYTVKEATVDGYASTVSGDMAQGYTVTNAETIDVKGTKTWDDQDDKDGLRPQDVTVRLYADGTEVAATQATGEGGWSWSFDGVAKYDADGNAISYTVSEDPVEGYETSIVGSSLSSAKGAANLKTEVYLTGTYSDELFKTGGHNYAQPDSGHVYARLYLEDSMKNLTQVGDQVELSADDGWTWQFGPLSADDVLHNTYKVGFYGTPDEEDHVSWQMPPVTQDSWRVLPSGAVEWTGEETDRPESVTVHLLADGAEVAQTEATAQGGWAWSFDLQPWLDADGNEVAYSVMVGNEDGRTITFNISNTHPPKEERKGEEAKPTEAKAAATPSTGDASAVSLSVGLAVAGLAACAVALRLRGTSEE